MSGKKLDANKLIEMFNLEPNQTLLIIFDAFGYDIAQQISEAFTEGDIPFCARFIPFTTQVKYAQNTDIPACLVNSISQSEALIFAGTDDDKCTRFRSEILTIATRLNKKVLHLPGVDFQLFTNTIKNLKPKKLNGVAKRILAAINKVNTVEIITKSKQGGTTQSHKLSISIKGRKMKQDVGIAFPGEITQLPSGEVYIAPEEFIAEGSVVINGSSPERVYRENDGDLIILEFTKGRLSLDKSWFSNTVNCQGFKNELIEDKASNPLNLVLCEFGIGINENINSFTGKPIHDEKAAGTLHIALGSNIAFGGKNECENHIDLIFIPEKILLDNKEYLYSWGLK